MLLLGLAARLAWVLFTGYTFEDAFITFRFARNLAEGLGFVFNAGEPIYGTTTPLLTLLLAGTLWLGLDVANAATLLGVLAGLAALGLWLEGLRCLGAAPWTQALGGLLLACSPLLWQMDGGGMETPLVLVLMLAAWLAALQHRPGWAGLWLGLMLWARLDTLLWGLLPGVMLFGQAQGRQRWQWLARLAGGMVAVYLPWLLFAWAYFGSPLPYTVLAKWAAYVQADGRSLWEHGRIALSYLLLFNLLPGWEGAQALLLALTLGLAGLGCWAWRRSLAVWGFLPFAALEVLRLVLQRATFFERYFVPALWALLALAGLGLAALWQGRVNRLFRILLGGWLLAVLAGLLAYRPQSNLLSSVPVMLLLWAVFCALWLLLERYWRWQLWGRALAGLLTLLLLVGCAVFGRIRAEAAQQVQVFRHERSLKAIGLWLAANTSADAEIMLEPLGYVGYYSRRVLRDEVGLVTPAVVESKLAGQMDVLAYISILNPDYIVVHCDDVLRWQQRKATAFLAHYRFEVRVDPLDFATGGRQSVARGACYEVWGRMQLAP